MAFEAAAFPTGVVLIAAEVDGVPVGMLASFFTSVYRAIDERRTVKTLLRV